jgi:hypothetical protein
MEKIKTYPDFEEEGRKALHRISIRPALASAVTLSGASGGGGGPLAERKRTGSDAHPQP